ncbi:MAG: FAD-binding oxidoreductase [Acidimicrobiaceae bacterium]|jgi:D-arginine dehydrogenase|nr:FAD-binding oxidoreductase [Acidimicrobiaceae bacterium]
MIYGFDVAIVGGGIAGVSSGAHLAEAGLSVVLLEAEATLAHHTTGRSAAQYLENYGNDTVRRLTLASRSYMEHPGEAADDSFLGSRPLLKVGRSARVAELQADVEHAKELVPSTTFVDGDEARRILPILRNDIEGALYEPMSMDIDVAGLHQSYVRRLRAAGGEIRPSSRVVGLVRAGDSWQISTGTEELSASIVVNAAGAWGDLVGAEAGAAPLGLHPLRRTIAIAAIPDGYDPADVARWPLTSFEPDSGPMVGYCKPEPGGLMVSPADETPSAPCDAKPEELDVALGLANLAEFTTLDVRHVRATWAGLRTFTSDRTPVGGFDPEIDGFFWLVGQGGYGIHTSEAMAIATTGIIVDDSFPVVLTDRGITAADLSPARPTLGGPLIEGH